MDSTNPNKLITKILKYVDDSKVIAKITSEDDVDRLQSHMQDIYDWEAYNNMKYNGGKFMNLIFGKQDIIENTMLFTTNIDYPIEEVSVAKDLGVMMDNKLDFKSQRKKVIKKANNKVSWILRTFITRDKEVMKILWRSLVQTYFDYAYVVWAPVRIKTDIEAQEGP